MKSFKRNALAATFSTLALSVILVSSASMYAPRAQAQIPVTDAASLAQMIENGIMRAKDSQIMQVIEQTKMQMMSLYSELSIDGVNNAISNMIARTGKSMQDVQNMEQLERSMPAQDICDTVSMSVNLEDILCKMESQTFSENQQSAGERAMASGRGTVVCDDNGANCRTLNRAPSVPEISSYNAKKATKLMTECAAIEAQTGTNSCGTPGLLANPPPQGVTGAEYEALQIQIDLAANPMVAAPKTDSTMERLKGTDAYNRSLAIDQRSTNFRAGIKSAMSHNLMLHHGTYNKATGERLPGEVFRLEEYMASRLGSSNWMCEATNTCEGADESTYVSPAELEKRKIQMDAVLLYLSLQQYKSSLRIEKCFDDIAILQLDPPQ